MYYLCRRFEDKGFPLLEWRDGRVVDCGGLENRWAERLRGFESLSLRWKVSEGLHKGLQFSLQKADNRCKIKVLQRFFFVYSPSSRAPDLPLITTLQSYSATHSATKKTPHLGRAQRHSIDRLLRSKVSPILSLQKLLEWRLVQASWERFEETYFRNHIYKRLCTRQFWPMIQ